MHTRRNWRRKNPPTHLPISEARLLIAALKVFQLRLCAVVNPITSDMTFLIPVHSPGGSQVLLFVLVLLIHNSKFQRLRRNIHIWEEGLSHEKRTEAYTDSTGRRTIRIMLEVSNDAEALFSENSLAGSHHVRENVPKSHSVRKMCLFSCRAEDIPKSLS